MKSSFFSLAVFMGCVLAAQAGLPDDEAALQRAIVSEGSQARLQQFFKKAGDGEKLVLGVIGGSITQGALSSAPDKRYSGVLLDWLKKTFPKAQFSLVNAGIGATGSDYGALRVERDLLSKKPDLAIIEFAVNDEDSPRLGEAYEGLVRQVLNAPSRPAAILLFMMRKDGGNVQARQSKIGERCNLPMLSYRDALWPEIQAGRLKWTEISPDAIHPNDAGHAFAGRLLCGFLSKELKAFKAPGVEIQDEEPLPSPLFSDRFEHCRLFDGDALKPVLNQGWTFAPPAEKQTPAGWVSKTPGSVLEFEIDGQSIMLAYWRINGPMGLAAVSVDGGAPKTLDAWFEKTWGGYRHTMEIASGLTPGKHKVRVELLSNKNPQSSGNEFRVLGIGSAGAKP